MSTKQSRRSRSIQGYDPNPPRCSACKWYRPEQKGAPAVIVGIVQIAPPLRHIAPTCVWPVKHRDSASFAVSPSGVCDKWQHKVTGEVLEDQPDTPHRRSADTGRHGSDEQAESASPSVLLIRGEK